MNTKQSVLHNYIKRFGHTHVENVDIKKFRYTVGDRHNLAVCIVNIQVSTETQSISSSKGRVPKFKKHESMVFDHQEGGLPKTKYLFRPVFVVLILTFSVQILKILSKKTILR